MTGEEVIPGVDKEVVADPGVQTETVVTETPEPTLKEKFETMKEKVLEEKSTETEKKPDAAPEEKKPDATEEKKPDEKPTEAPKTETASAEAFKPNTTIKVHEKEIEIPKEFHSLMKDKDSEKNIRDIFEKAHGLPIVKERLENERQDKAKVAAERDNFKNAINEAGSIYVDAVKNQDYLKLDAFFKKVGVDPNIVMQYALKKAEYAQMQPAERAAIDNRLQAEERSMALQKESQSAASRTQQLEMQMRIFMLDTRLESPDTSPLAKAFDAQVGRPGAFKDEVVREGQLAWVASKKDLTPEEAIQAVIKRYNIKAPAEASATEIAPEAKVAAEAATKVAVKPAPGTKVVVERKTGTIPNLQGGSASPLATKPKNLEDLRGLYKAKQAEMAG